MNPSLTTSYLGLTLPTPLVASSSPLTGHLDGVRDLVAAGAGAVVLPSLFEEALERESIELSRLLRAGTDHFAEALHYLPESRVPETGPDRYLRHLEAVRHAVDVPVVASLNGASPGGWVAHARRLEDAGADALELNWYVVAADPAETGAEVEARLFDLVAAVRAEVTLPLAVKLGPSLSALANVAVRLEGLGVDGLVLFNRFLQPDLDLDSLAVVPRVTLSTSADLLLPLRWIAVLRPHLRGSLAATGGIRSGGDLAKVLAAGADVGSVASVVLEEGPSAATRILDELGSWLAARDYAGVTELRGSMSRAHAPDPDAYERAQYETAVHSWVPGGRLSR